MTVELIRSIKKVEEVRFEQTFERLNVVGCSDELGDREQPLTGSRFEMEQHIGNLKHVSGAYM